MFSISDCRIIWNERAKIPKRDKTAIKADLKTMSNIVEEAMSYTKDKILKENRETVVRFWLNTNTGDNDYYIEIYYERACTAWSFDIRDAGNHSIVGEITSKKWPFLLMLQEEDTEVETI